jgi:hypothetical protein
MPDYAQGSARRGTDLGTPVVGVDSNGKYSTLALDAEGRLLAAEREPALQTTADLHAPAANTDAVVTYAAPGVGLAHAIDGLAYSATGTIAAAVALTVKDGTDVVVSLVVGATGVQVIPFPGGLRASANAALVLTLPALGASGTGRMNALGHRVVVTDYTARLGLLDFRQPSQSSYVPVI